MGSLHLTEAWTGAWSSEPHCAMGHAMRLRVTITLDSWKQLTGPGAALQAIIDAPAWPQTDTASGQLTLQGRQLHYLIVGKSCRLLGTRKLSLRGFPAPMSVMSASLHRDGERTPTAYASLRLNLRTGGQQLLRSLRYRR